MAITYTWKLTSLKKYDNYQGTDHVVFQTYWKKIGTDENGNTGEFSGATPLDVSTLNLDSFTPYENLTEEQVLGWIKPVVVGDYERHVNAKIAEQINDKVLVKTQVEERELPWISEEERATKYSPPPIVDQEVPAPSGPPSE